MAGRAGGPLAAAESAGQWAARRVARTRRAGARLAEELEALLCGGDGGEDGEAVDARLDVRGGAELVRQHLRRARDLVLGRQDERDHARAVAAHGAEAEASRLDGCGGGSHGCRRRPALRRRAVLRCGRLALCPGAAVREPPARRKPGAESPAEPQRQPPAPEWLCPPQQEAAHPADASARAARMLSLRRGRRTRAQLGAT